MAVFENRQQQGSGGIRKNNEEATTVVQASSGWSAQAQKKEAVPGFISKVEPRFAEVGYETGKHGLHGLGLNNCKNGVAIYWRRMLTGKKKIRISTSV